MNIESKLCQLVNSLPDHDHRNFEILSSLFDAYELGIEDFRHHFISSLKGELPLPFRVAASRETLKGN